ncbi:hypothetical protein SCLCIDRAFT_428502 [Scleroderma citrinum Foug A]|uniref:FAD-binding domain-containing protein n=1 Tax=Scleroderma citrinum Foug A TaxID=1036808 RepID=A0A0C3CYM0_9AGAM|nr:hypothetical protein SCLCIDRAFT_428502 [Scleroderma citrinum Foug A]
MAIYWTRPRSIPQQTIMALPVLVVGAGPAALVAALTLIQNNIPVRIIEKEQQYRRGQRGAGVHPRSFEVFHFLHVPEVHDLATSFPLIQLHKTGSVESLKLFNACPYTEPTPAIPYYNPKFLGQPNLEGTLRSHLARYGCTVELGTQLASFTQDSTCVHVRLKRYADDGSETEEEIQAAYLIGADGAKGMTRKLLGLTFLGETRHEHLILADIRLEAKHLDRNHWHFFGEMPISMVSLRPTDELGSDGYQVLISNTARDLTHLVHNEELLVAYIKDAIGLGDDVKILEVLWLSDFRPNIRMVNRFGVGRVFVAGAYIVLLVGKG